MSRLLPEQIRLGLGATYTVLANVHGSRLAAWHKQEFEASPRESIWQQSLQTALDWLAQSNPRNARIHVLLSAELAPLHLLPWRDEIDRADQQTLLARNHFQRVYGETAQNWKVLVSPTAYGDGWLASAVDESLLASLMQQVKTLGATVSVVEPLLLSHFNSNRRRLQSRDCWMLLAEPEKLVALRLRKGRWQLLQTLPATTLQYESLQQVLGRESRLAGLDDSVSELFLIGAISAAVIDAINLSKLEGAWKAENREESDSLYLLGAPA